MTAPRTVAKRTPIFVLFSAAPLVWLGCGGGSNGPSAPEGPPRVARLSISPASTTITTAQQQLFTATAFDGGGSEIDLDQGVSWASSDIDVAPVHDPDAITEAPQGDAAAATGVQTGEATITASVEGVTAQAHLTVEAPASFQDVSAGPSHSCAVDDRGNAYCWGDPQSYLGRGPDFYGDPHLPALVSGEHTYLRITASFSHTCALTGGNTVYCWGYGSGVGFEEGSATPRAIDGSYTQLAASSDRTCAIGTGGVGELYCWEEGPARQVTFDEFYNWRMVSLGNFHTCGLEADGTAYCWGRDNRDQLGNGSAGQTSRPDRVAGELEFRLLNSSRYTTCGITTDDRAYCWGQNLGTIGDGTSEDRSVPTLVRGGHTWSWIDTGSTHTCGVTTAGVGYCWGVNQNGQLGTVDRLNHDTPTRVAGNHRWEKIVPAAGKEGFARHTCGVTTGGEVYCWGRNDGGQLGDGTTTQRNRPQRVAF